MGAGKSKGEKPSKSPGGGKTKKSKKPPPQTSKAADSPVLDELSLGSSGGREDTPDVFLDPRSPRGAGSSPSPSGETDKPAKKKDKKKGKESPPPEPKGSSDSLEEKPDDEDDSKQPSMIYGGQHKKFSKDDFVIDVLIGKGSFGKVFLVHAKEDGAFYAMKVLRKEAVVARKQVAHTMTERGVLEKIQHPFVVKLHYAFQTPEKLYMILDFVNGGELFFHLKQEGRFSEQRTLFYVAELTMALSHLHRIGIVYRDLKPENILLSADGHICITDFGLSKELQPEEGTRTFCGTPEYLAPEILLNEGHGKAVDWWSLGTFMYEMLTGLPPFYSQNTNIMYQKILNAELKFPSYISAEAQSLLRGFLNRDPNQRLGNTAEVDGEDVMAHPFFLGLDWTKLFNKEVTPPFVPPVKSPTDLTNIDPVFTSERAVDSVVASNALDMISKNDQFKGFTFEADSMMN